MKKNIFVFIITNILFLNVLNAQYTAIPDVNFEQALIDLGIDTDIDGQVLTEDINTITSLIIIDKNISDLTGIQDFIDLTSLNCAYNNLSSIDISKNTSLTSFDFSSNQITSITLSNNSNLEKLTCSQNQLEGINISTNTSLTEFNCSNNQLSSLDVSNNTLLESLTCSSNQLTTLNLTVNDKLTFLNCSNNQLSAIDIVSNTLLINLFCANNELSSLNLAQNDSLKFIDCSNNQLTDLDVSSNRQLTNITCSSNQLNSFNINLNDSLTFLSCANNRITSIDISHNLVLTNLICSSNQLVSIDISNNTILEKLNLSYNMLLDLDATNDTSLRALDCSNNQLSSLNLQNGKNTGLNEFSSINNPDLRCIKVDDPSAANNYATWKKDDIASYNTNCILYTYVPDDNFEAALSAYDDIANDDFVPTANIENLNSLDVSVQNIEDLTGIEDFSSLVTLDCSTNSLINLNTSINTNIVTLNCSSNSLEALTLNFNTNLTNLDATNNPLLSCIQVDDVDAANAQANWQKDAGATYSLNCNTNKTYIPDDNFEQVLIDLGYDHGGLDNYVVTDSINTINNLDISDKNILDLTGIKNFLALDTLNCSNNNLQTLDISDLISLQTLTCYGNSLSILNIDANTLLLELSCGSNNLSSLDVSNNTSLQKLSCDANQLSGINTSNNTDLQYLNCNSNNITDLGFDITGNVNLEELFCSNNRLSSINLKYNKSLEVLNCGSNQLNQLNLDSCEALVKLDCSLNLLSNLDLRKDTLLEDIKCNFNKIKILSFVQNPLIRKITCDDNLLTNIDVSINDSIREFSASNNQLSQIMVDSSYFLELFNVINNKIDSLSFPNNDSLRVLLCANNNLQKLNIDSTAILKTLNCENNQLSSLNINNNDSLVELNCSKNQLETLDVGNSLILEELTVNDNKLTDLDISVNDSLRKFSCTNNKISSLDFSNNPELVSISCSSNQLSSLNVKNGNNSILATFHTINNPDLLCIEIDDETNIGDSWVKDASANWSENCHYSETYVPDDNFEAALSSILGESSNNNDNYISTASIEVLTSLDISNKNISDLTGIKDFTELSSFNVSGNPIDSLDVSSNAKLINLNCSNTQLDSLGLINNSSIQILDFSSNQLSEIDLSYLDGLTNLVCDGNQLISLDLSYNTDLVSVSCSSNQLTILNVKNANNIVLTSFNATNNSDLYCIEVDDPTMANNGTGAYASWQTDAATSFNENCHYNETYIPDDNFEQALIDLGYDYSGTGPLDDYVPTKKINKLTYLSISNKEINDLTGIEDFSALVTLNCGNNNLTSLNFSGNLMLENLICKANELSNLDISSNTLIKKLDFSDNLITSINLSKNDSLEKLLCSSNQLTNLNIINDTSLVTVNCSFNKLITVDANNGYNHKLLNFDLRNNPDLRCILVDDIDVAATYPYWFKDISAAYKTICDDDDNDGVADSDDLCPNTPFGDLVDVFGCSIFMLPTDNFTIYVRSETCRTNNNGLVNISATEILNYTATLIGNEDTISHIFTDKLEIRNLLAGTYELCITVEDKQDYLQCYSVVITEPEDLGVELELNKLDNSVLLKMSGSNKYIINLNNTIFNTQESEIRLYLEKAENIISVKTDSECQGVFKETIFLANKYVVYPNPFNNYLNLFIGNDIIENLNIEIYSNSGQLIWSNQYSNKSGIIKINTTDFNTGIYYLHLKSEINQSSFKIIKE